MSSFLNWYATHITNSRRKPKTLISIASGPNNKDIYASAGSSLELQTMTSTPVWFLKTAETLLAWRFEDVIHP